MNSSDCHAESQYSNPASSTYHSGNERCCGCPKSLEFMLKNATRWKPEKVYICHCNNCGGTTVREIRSLYIHHSLSNQCQCTHCHFINWDSDATSYRTNPTSCMLISDHSKNWNETIISPSARMSRNSSMLTATSGSFNFSSSSSSSSIITTTSCTNGCSECNSIINNVQRTISKCDHCSLRRMKNSQVECSSTIGHRNMTKDNNTETGNAIGSTNALEITVEYECDGKTVTCKEILETAKQISETGIFWI